MPASVPNGRTFCRADKRARTLPRYLAPSLMTARTSAMPSGRFPSVTTRLLDPLRAVAARVVPSHR
jgi:hypothetical protein